MTVTNAYHIYNACKFRVLLALVKAKQQRKAATPTDIANLTGMEIVNVRHALYRYIQKRKDPLIRRTEKKRSKEYQYEITAAGEKVLKIMLNRLKMGMDLNFAHDGLSRYSSLVLVFKRGAELGMTEDDARARVGIKPRKT